MIAVVAGTTLTTPDTTRAYTVTIGPHDLTGDVQWDSLEFEDQGASSQGTTGLRVNGSLATFPGVRDQQFIEIEDHVAGGIAFRGFLDSRRPARAPVWDQIEVVASDHTSLLDNVVPFEQRPAGESDRARIGYLWGLYAGGFLAADLTYVQEVSASLPEQIFAGVSLRQALDLIAAQASSSAFWYLDRAGRLHYGTSESNDAPADVTSDTPGVGEIAPQDLNVDYDSKGYIGAVYVRGKTDAGSGWVYSQTARATHNGLVRTGFFDAPDCTTSTMRDSLGNMYLGRVGAAVPRGSFSCTSTEADGWRAGQNVTVRSSHLNSLNQAFRIARVRTSILGPLGTRPAGLRRYEVEFGGTRAGQSTGGTGPVVGTGLVGDILDDNGNLLLGTGNDAATAGFGAAVRRFITSGVYNGDFALTPPYPDATIVNAYNPLPFWSFVQSSGTSITAVTEADSGSGSGRVLRFDMAAGAAGDDSYIEQIIPINASRSQAYSYRFRCAFETDSTVSLAEWELTAQYLTEDGTATGAAGAIGGATSTIGAATVFDRSIVANGGGQVPTDAYFLRVRVSFQRGTAATTVAESLRVLEAHLIVGTSEAALEDITTPSNDPARIMHVNGTLYLGYLSTPPTSVAVLAPFSFADDTTPPSTSGQVVRQSNEHALYMGDGTQARPVTPVGWAGVAYACNAVHLIEATNSETLPVSGGSLLTYMDLSAPMILDGLTIRTSSAPGLNAKTLEWALYLDIDNTSSTATRVTNAVGTFSFTAAASTSYSSSCATPPTLAPGRYWCVLRNTSATNSFGLGIATGTFPGTTAAQKKTLGSALSSTLDLITGWVDPTGATRAPYMVLRGRVLGLSSPW